MSLDAVASAAVVWLAAMGTGDAMKPEHAAPPPSVALEPLFADIVKRAGALKAEVDALQQNGQALPADFAKKIAELSELDMKGHVTLAQRGTDGDLKCILKGISEDLPVKLEAMQAAEGDRAKSDAVTDMSYLLRDNVEVITTPPKADSLSGT
ncbi:hypothetical protein [Phenylobacterium sp.]|uniref:hypothetical protein n=1 Tax=Phenylobacterium sp. TaxID=1871053 RepID=UPI0035ADE154